MHKEPKLFDKLKETIRTNKPFIFFVCFVFIFILYTDDRFRATFTSVAQICTGIGAIVALLANLKQIERQNKLEEERIKIKWRRRIFVAIINEYLDLFNDLTEEEIESVHEIIRIYYLRNKYIYLFNGEKSNFKITNPIDIEIAKSILR